MTFGRLNYSLKSYYKVIFIVLLVISTLLAIAIMIISKVNQVKKEHKIFKEDDNDPFIYEDYSYIKCIPQESDYLIFIKEEIMKVNDNQVVNNENLFEKVKSSTVVLVIHVGKNILLVKELVKSLKSIVGISGAYLIFTHDYFNEDINDFIGNISFAKWSQIFYPYMTQLYPKEFPGPDKKFCSKDFVCEENNNIRRHEHVQMKHFWWWQVNFIFEKMKILSEYSNFIIFLEEGKYILKDLLYMMKVLEEMLPQACPACEILTFGTRDPNISQFDVIESNVFIEPWNSQIRSSGFAFNRTTWLKIKKDSYKFCHCNDYHWDVCLRYLGSKRSLGQFMLFSSEAPRVLQISCGEKVNCNYKKNLNKALNFASSVKRGLFPQSVLVREVIGDNVTVVERGGWNDVRDQELCMYMTIFNAMP